MRLAAIALALVAIAASCATASDTDQSSITAPESLEITSATTSTPEAQPPEPPTTSTDSPVSDETTPGTDPTSTTTAGPQLLPIPEPITDPPPGAGRWGDVVVSIESFLDATFTDFAGAGSYEPPDRDRVLGLSDSDGEIPSCDRANITATTVEDNALAAVCQEGQLVIWDEDDLFAELLADYGETGPAVVIAHEFGHVIQSQAGVLRSSSSFIVEQQADCLAGAFAAWSRARGVAPFDTVDSLDNAVGATVSFRDQPGSSADAARAHGSGFDRVRAFQEGFDLGVTFCASYPDEPPTSTEIPFGQGEFETGGNLGFEPLLEAVTPYFEDFFTAVVPSWETPALSAEDLRLWTREHRIVGDNSTGTRLAMAYGAHAQTLLEIPTDGPDAVLQQACVAGGVFQPLFFPGPNSPEDLRLSAGDLDEAVITLSRFVDRADEFEAGFLFELVTSLRLGFFEGLQACDLT